MTNPKEDTREILFRRLVLRQHGTRRTQRLCGGDPPPPPQETLSC